MLFVLPTEDDAKTFVTGNVEPTFSASAALFGALSGDQQEKNRNTMLSRRFPGGSLKVVAAKAPRALRGPNIRVLFMDEVDGMEVTAEGNPLRLAEMRTQQFDDRKIVVGSTPVYLETSLVLAEYAKSDQRVFEVPCPACDNHHEIKWPDIHWPEGQPGKATGRARHAAAWLGRRQGSIGFSGPLARHTARCEGDMPASVSIALCRPWRTRHGRSSQPNFWPRKIDRKISRPSSTLCLARVGGKPLTR